MVFKKKMKKKILITGCSGFVGINLILKLNKLKKYSLIGTYYKKKPHLPKNIKLIKSDLTNKAYCLKVLKNVDYVYVCSANSSGAGIMESKPLVHLTPNLVMNTYLLESAYENKVKKFIFLSSNTVYPVSRKKMKEKDSNFNFFEKYFIVGWMKRFSEIMCEMYSKKIIRKMQTIIVRPGNLYGPYDKFDWEKSKFIAATIRKVLENKNGIIKVWGDGKDLKDFLYIDDFTDALIKILKIKDIFYVANIAMGKSYSIKNILKLILKIQKVNLKILYDLSKPQMIPVRNIDISKIKKDLNWRPRVTIQEGLKKTIDWYKNCYQ
jgi:GDP-L-fucose synthase